MPNSLSSTGLITSTQAELLANYTAAFQSIYGSSVNLSSDTPDGQMINLFIQSVLDLQDLLTQIYNSFDPDNAIGVILDQRVAINGIQRQAGTYSTTNITIVTSQSVNLYGLDQTVQPVFTVADNSGNQWNLMVTQTGVGPGTVVALFESATPGANQTIPNTITTPVTVVLGVTSVNNPTTYATLGINEESDANLKVRRQQSVALSAQGYLSSILAAVENVTGISSAYVYENTGDTTNGFGMPGHSIWVIIAGAAASASIANAIYTKRNAGCGMYGSITYPVTQVDGSSFNILWDNVAAENIFISFNAASIDGINAPNIAAISAGLVTNFVPSVYQEVNVNTLATKAQLIDPNALITSAGFSTGKLQTFTLSGIAASGTFVFNYGAYASAAINWNDSIGTIQSKVQAITGMSATLVTGSIASQSLVVTIALSSVASLFTVTSNSLQTGGAVPITFSLNNNYSNTLSPISPKYQFAVAQANIVILPMILSPITATVTHGTTKQLTGVGGYGVLVYSLSVNNSGGSINSSTGLYTAGATPSVDTAKVVDTLGNSVTATMTVI